jgi:hypothetical protein
LQSFASVPPHVADTYPGVSVPSEWHQFVAHVVPFQLAAVTFLVPFTWFPYPFTVRSELTVVLWHVTQPRFVLMYEVVSMCPVCDPVPTLYVADELPPWQLSQSASTVPVVQLSAVPTGAPNGVDVVVPLE